MRLRKKKFLDDRLTAVKEFILVQETIDLYKIPKDQRVDKRDLNEIFGNDNPVHLEIGCGKGGFIIGMANKYPYINFLAVEKVANVMVSGCEMAKKENLKNVKFLNCMADNLNYYLHQNSIDKIYLNFSCPYPKKTYANSRLTHERFLNEYKEFLKINGEIWQKTDNQNFFEYSLESFSKNNFVLKNISLDLHNSAFENNVVTEYEKNFIEKGCPIYRLEAVHTRK